MGLFGPSKKEKALQAEVERLSSCKDKGTVLLSCI